MQFKFSTHICSLIFITIVSMGTSYSIWGQIPPASSPPRAEKLGLKQTQGNKLYLIRGQSRKGESARLYMRAQYDNVGGVSYSLVLIHRKGQKVTRNDLFLVHKNTIPDRLEFIQGLLQLKKMSDQELAVWISNNSKSSTYFPYPPFSPYPPPSKLPASYLPSSAADKLISPEAAKKERIRKNHPLKEKTAAERQEAVQRVETSVEAERRHHVRSSLPADVPQKGLPVGARPVITNPIIQAPQTPTMPVIAPVVRPK